MVAAGVGDVHRVAPRRAIGVGEVRPVAREHVAFRSHVVVDDVEDDGQPEPVRGVDEAGEPVGAAVGVLHGEGEHAVVAPVASARELGHRHHLDRGDTEVAQPRQVTDRCVEGALGGERADVHLVEDGVGQLHARPVVVVPAEQRVVDHRRRPVHTVGLPPRRRVSEFVAVDHESVPVAVPEVVDLRRPVPAVARHRSAHPATVGRGDGDSDGRGVRRPHEQPGSSVAEHRRAETRGARVSRHR